jgi:hypothetical protein
MLATLAGVLALLLGLALLLLPLLATELSRPRDSVWGALVLLLGLVLVTSADRLTGAPMLAVLCGGLLIGRLGSEVGQARWRQLGDEERQRLGSAERWRSSLAQLLASCVGLAAAIGRIGTGLASWIRERRQPRIVSKRWVRPETADTTDTADTADSAGSAASPADAAGAAAALAADADGGVAEVGDFAEIDALLTDAVPETEPTPPRHEAG